MILAKSITASPKRAVRSSRSYVGTPSGSSRTTPIVCPRNAMSRASLSSFASFAIPSSLGIRNSSFLNIQIPDIKRIVLDILASRLDHVAHQLGEHLIRLDRILVVQVDLQQFALFRVHRGVEKFLRIHFAKAFETLD